MRMPADGFSRIREFPSRRARGQPRGAPALSHGITAPAMLRRERDQRGVVTLTLDRPDVRNALDAALVGRLTAAVDEIARDAAARVLVVTGAGEAFCAGADLRWLRDTGSVSQEEVVADSHRLHELLVALDSLPRPVVARVNGAAFGGALGLVACADVAVAARGAQMGFSEVRLGLAPAVIAPFVLPRIGVANARRWFLTGERFHAERAAAAGLVHEVVDRDRLDTAVDGVVGALLRGGPHAQAAVKDLLRRMRAIAEPADAGPVTTRIIARLRASHEGQEGMAAFLERRRPDWHNGD